MSITEALTRSVPVSEVAFDGSTLEALFVPWDESTTIYGDPGHPEPYGEGFKRSAFDLQLDTHPQTVRAVTLLPEHGSSEHYGRTRELRRVDAGLHGVVTVMASHREDVEQLVEMGVDHVSIEFLALHKPRIDTSGVHWRTSGVLLQAVALTPSPAYASSKVLALREAVVLEEAERSRAARIAALDAELVELRAGGDRWR